MKIIGYAGVTPLKSVKPVKFAEPENFTAQSEKPKRIFPRIKTQSARAVSAVVLIGFFAFAMVFTPSINAGDVNVANVGDVSAFAGIGPLDTTNAAPVSAVTAAGQLQKLVVLDAGHGGMDGGAVRASDGGDILEKNINLAIVKDLAAMLKFAGYTVVLTRDADRSIHDGGAVGARQQKVSDMKNRKAIIDANAEGIFISVHQNLFTDPRFFGAQMFYLNENPLNTELAQIAQEAFRELQPANNREIAQSDGMFLLKGTRQPAILAECGFLSNADDAANLTDRDYQKKVAFTLLKTIDEFYARQYGLAKTETVSEENISEDNYIN